MIKIQNLKIGDKIKYLHDNDTFTINKIGKNYIYGQFIDTRGKTHTCSFFKGNHIYSNIYNFNFKGV